MVKRKLITIVVGPRSDADHLVHFVQEMESETPSNSRLIQNACVAAEDLPGLVLASLEGPGVRHEDEQLRSHALCERGFDSFGSPIELRTTQDSANVVEILRGIFEIPTQAD